MLSELETYMQMLWQTRQNTRTTTSTTLLMRPFLTILLFILVDNHELILKDLEVSNRMVTTNFQKVFMAKMSNLKLLEKIFFMLWELQMDLVLDTTQIHTVQLWVKDFHNHLLVLQDLQRTSQTDYKQKKKSNSMMKPLKWRF